MFIICFFLFFFFQAEDGIRDWSVTGVQTCALPILSDPRDTRRAGARRHRGVVEEHDVDALRRVLYLEDRIARPVDAQHLIEIGRASCRERVYIAVVSV